MSKNIFEALGLKADHRPTSRICQLVRHTEEVTVAKSKEGPFFVDVKYDGNHAVIPVKGGKILGIFSRVGGAFTNTKALLKLIDADKIKDGVYFAELYCERDIMPMQKFQALHGPSRVNPLTEPQQEIMNVHSRLAFFDYISLDAFIGDKAGVAKDDTPLEVRRKKLEKMVKKFSKSSRIHHAKYVEVDTIEEGEEVCDQYIESGKEGGVLKGKNHPYVCGHKNFHFMKKVKKLTLDLECIGFTKGTNGKRKGTLESLSFKYGDEGQHTIVADLGKGYDDELRLEMLAACEKGGKKSPVGKIFEIYALELIGKTNLRQPKVGKIREDKEEPDMCELPEDKKKTKKDKKAKKDKKESVEQTVEESFNEVMEESKGKKDKKDKKGKSKDKKKKEKAVDIETLRAEAIAVGMKPKKDGKADKKSKKHAENEPDSEGDEEESDKGKTDKKSSIKSGKDKKKEKKSKKSKK